MKRILTLLIMMMIVSTVGFASNHYILVAPEASFPLANSGKDMEVNASIVYTGYFGGGQKEAEVQEEAVQTGPYVSTAGYMPQRYYAYEERQAELASSNVTLERTVESYRSIGLHLALGYNNVGTLYKESSDVDFQASASLRLGLAMRQQLSPMVGFYERLGLSVRSDFGGGYAEAGLSMTLGMFAMELGARFDAGIGIPFADGLENFDFADAELAMAISPYIALGVAF